MIDNKKFAERCRKSAEAGNTRYALGGWGQPATTSYKNYFINSYPYNRSIANVFDENNNVVKSDRKQVILNTPSNFQFFDCNCWNKAMIDSDDSGFINYGYPCPDVTIVQMLKDCTDVSDDFSNIMPGELVVYESKQHCGVYIGDGYTAECVPDWKDGVQIRKLDNRWKWHGKMTKYIEYTYADEKGKPDTADIQKKLESAQAEIAEALELIKNL